MYDIPVAGNDELRNPLLRFQTILDFALVNRYDDRDELATGHGVNTIRHEGMSAETKLIPFVFKIKPTPAWRT